MSPACAERQLYAQPPPLSHGLSPAYPAVRGPGQQLGEDTSQSAGPRLLMIVSSPGPAASSGSISRPTTENAERRRRILTLLWCTPSGSLPSKAAASLAHQCCRQLRRMAWDGLADRCLRLERRRLGFVPGGGSAPAASAQPRADFERVSSRNGATASSPAPAHRAPSVSSSSSSSTSRSAARAAGRSRRNQAARSVRRPADHHRDAQLAGACAANTGASSAGSMALNSRRLAALRHQSWCPSSSA